MCSKVTLPAAMLPSNTSQSSTLRYVLNAIPIYPQPNFTLLIFLDCHVNQQLDVNRSWVLDSKFSTPKRTQESELFAKTSQPQPLLFKNCCSVTLHYFPGKVILLETMLVPCPWRAMIGVSLKLR